jgi:hypothetical protein
MTKGQTNLCLALVIMTFGKIYAIENIIETNMRVFLRIIVFDPNSNPERHGFGEGSWI